MTDVRDTVEDYAIPPGEEDAAAATAAEEVTDVDENPAVDITDDDANNDSTTAAAAAVDESILESGSAESSEEGTEKSAPPVDPNEALLQAMNHKEDGNNHFKSGDLISAARSYRHGTTLLKNLNQGNTGDEQ
eukprot:scaffold14363_cov98-Skeletonema_dohrnii-CCMP3373.AAC.1